MFKTFAIPATQVEMSHEEFQAIIPAYAFGATDPDETREVAEHLRHCRECRELLASYRALSDAMLYVAEGVEAPSRAGEGLQRKLAATPRRSLSMRIWDRGSARPAWTLAALALLALLLTNLYWFHRAGRLEEQVAAQVTQFNALSAAPVAFLYSDGSARHGQGVVYAATGEGPVLLCVYDMPALPDGMVYQVWLIRDGQRDSAGLFQVSAKGYGLLLMQLDRPLADYEAMGITVEPAGGSPGPTSPRVIGGKL